MRRLIGIFLVGAAVLGVHPAAEAAFEDRPAWQRAGFTVLAGIENVVPIASAFAAPRCLPGYLLCKLSFAGFSVVAAGEHLLFSGGSDMVQTRSILQRGFGGDWYLSARHAAGDAMPIVLPDPVPESAATEP